MTACAKDTTTFANDVDRLLNEFQLAEIAGVSVQTTRRWRSAKEGPRFVKINSSVRYRASDVRAWMEALTEGAA